MEIIPHIEGIVVYFACCTDIRIHIYEDGSDASRYSISDGQGPRRRRCGDPGPQGQEVAPHQFSSKERSGHRGGGVLFAPIESREPAGGFLGSWRMWGIPQLHESEDPSSDI